MKGGDEFRRALMLLDLTQREFALLLGLLGDPRPFPTRERWVHRLSSGSTAAVPGEAVALLHLLGRIHTAPLPWSTLAGELGAAPSPTQERTRG